MSLTWGHCWSAAPTPLDAITDPTTIRSGLCLIRGERGLSKTSFEIAYGLQHPMVAGRRCGVGITRTGLCNWVCREMSNWPTIRWGHTDLWIGTMLSALWSWVPSWEYLMLCCWRESLFSFRCGWDHSEKPWHFVSLLYYLCFTLLVAYH